MKIMKLTIKAILLSLGLLIGYYKAPMIFKNNSTDTIKAVIFDLDGVLFTTSKKIYTKIAPHIPLYAARALFDRRGMNVKKHYLETLSKIPGKSNLQSFHQGKPMPQIMVDWQTGTDVFQAVCKGISNNPSMPYGYKKLMLAIAKNVFDPQRFINSRTTIKEGIKLLKAIKKAGYKVYVLSNWDAQSFPLLQKKYSYIMTMFDGTCISGDVKMLKPNKDIFHACLQKFNLKASECLFIDDEQHNIEGAQSVGITAIKFDRKNSDQAISKLKKLHILKEK